MIRKTSLSLILALIISVPIFSQVKNDSIYKNTIKLNTVAIALNNVSLLYERSFGPHWSASLGAGYRWGGSIPKVFGLGDVIVTSSTGGLRGYSFTPELRYYFNYCGCGGEQTGFYAGLYGRYTKFYGDLKFNIWTGSDYVDVGGIGDLREMGVGIQLGYQFVFAKRFSVDLMFAGPRTSSNKLSVRLDSQYAEEIADILEEEINKRLEWLGKDPISINAQAETEVNFSFTNFRYGVAIGYRF
jgi:hypothetical protein